MLQSKTLAALAVALTSAATSAAYAASTSENDALAIHNAKISLAKAVTTAEQHANGQASRAEYENTTSGMAYDVEVVSGQKVVDVTVDAQNGSILNTAQDSVDQDDRRDEVD